MSTVHVIRHAQASMFAADYDELSEPGREQARILGVTLAQRFAEAGRPGFDAVFCGPARRHVDTAALAGEGFAASEAAPSFPAPIILPGFDEHDGQALVTAAMTKLAQREGGLGAHPRLAKLVAAAMDASLERRERSRAWQKLFEEVMGQWLKDELELDGIERWPDFSRRVREAFAELRERGRGEVALFTSVGPTAVILGEVLDLPPQRAFEQAWRLYNTSITRVVYSGARMTLDGFNEVAHLPLRRWTHR